jgi:hypothetical protein
MAQAEIVAPATSHSDVPTHQTASTVLDNSEGQPAVKGSKGSDVKVEVSRSDPALIELNAQLYARGLTRSGLKLEGLNNKARDQVIKVISKLLSQRAVSTSAGSMQRQEAEKTIRQDDFTQLEATQTSHRVLSHDLDRLTELHKQLKQRVVSAEKDKEIARSQVRYASGFSERQV